MFGWEIAGERKKGGNRQEKLQSFPSHIAQTEDLLFGFQIVAFG